MAEKNKSIPIDYDTLWKQIITDLFDDFIQFFLPEAYPLINFQVPVEFLEQELHQIIVDLPNKGKAINDKLAKVRLKNGADKWILIHIEVQASDKSDFSERMFKYFYRIFDRYKQKITAIAIYPEERYPSVSDQYNYDFLGTRVSYNFNTYKVKDADEALLEASKNPFGLAVLACKYVLQTKKNLNLRFQFKLRLIRLTRQRNYSRERIVSLLRFIDLMLTLPKELDKQLILEVLDSVKILDKKMEKLRTISPHEDRIALLTLGISFTELLEIQLEEKAKELAEEKVKVLVEEKAQILAEEKAHILAKQMVQEVAEKKAKEIADKRDLEGKKAFAMKLLQNKKLSLQEIAEVTELPIIEIQQLK